MSVKAVVRTTDGGDEELRLFMKEVFERGYELLMDTKRLYEVNREAGRRPSRRELQPGQADFVRGMLKYARYMRNVDMCQMSYRVFGE